MRKRLLILGLSLIMVLSCSAAVFATEARFTTNEGILHTSNNETVTVTPVEDERNDENGVITSSGESVTVKDEVISTRSANVSKTISLKVGKSYSYGPFYMGANSPWDPNVGDAIDITVSAVTSGKYKVIVTGIDTNGSEVFNYESPQYSSTKTFTINNAKGGVAYTVTVVNTSSTKLNANVGIVTYKS